MAVVVQKFGGTSVGDTKKIAHVARIIANAYDAGNQVTAVVSAMGKSTDTLVSLATEVMGTPSGREYDALLSTGEMVTASVMAMTLNAMGYQAISLNGAQAGIITEELPNRARILEIKTKLIQKHLDNGIIVIITGFQGIDTNGNTTTMGRGGSDTSAVAIAGALGAERCDIYTDVKGVYSTDPRIVPEAVKQESMAYIEMMELARVGAKVLHPRSVETARRANVTICVRSTFDLDDLGTLVLGVNKMKFDQQNRSVAGIACDENQARLALTGVPDIPGVAAEVFGSLANENISVDMIIQSLHTKTSGKDGKERSTNDIAFTTSKSDVSDAIKVLERICREVNADKVLSETNIAKVSIVGAGMIDRPGIAADMFQALAKGGVNINMISTSEIKISCLVAAEQAKQAVQLIHTQFFSAENTLENVLVNEKIGY